MKKLLFSAILAVVPFIPPPDSIAQETVDVTFTATNFYGAPAASDFYVTCRSETAPSAYGYTDAEGKLTLQLQVGATYEALMKEDSYGNSPMEYMRYRKRFTVSADAQPVSLDMTDGYLHEVQISAAGLDTSYHRSYYELVNTDLDESISLSTNAPNIPARAIVPAGNYQLKATNHLGNNYQDSGDQMPARQDMSFTVDATGRTVCVDYTPWQQVTYEFPESGFSDSPAVQIFNTYDRTLRPFLQSSMLPKGQYLMVTYYHVYATQTYYYLTHRFTLADEPVHVSPLLTGLDTTQCARLNTERISLTNMPDGFDTLNVEWTGRSINGEGVYYSSEIRLLPGEHFLTARGIVTYSEARYKLLYHGWHTVTGPASGTPVVDLTDYRFVHFTLPAPDVLTSQPAWYDLFIYDSHGQLYEQIRGSELTDCVEGGTLHARLGLPVGQYTLRQVYRGYDDNDQYVKVSQSAEFEVPQQQPDAPVDLPLNDEPTGLDAAKASALGLALQGGRIVVSAPAAAKAVISLYDMSGRILVRRAVAHGDGVDLPADRGTYVVVLRQGGQAATLKVSR